MEQQLYQFINNKHKSNVFRITIFSILFLIIIDQFYSLTKLSSIYTNTFDYGKMIRKTCNDGYTEYETERFQTMNNILNIKLKNDNTYDRYHSIIFIIAIITLLYVAYFFAFICIESSFDGILSKIVGNSTSSISNNAKLAMAFVANINIGEMAKSILTKFSITGLIVVVCKSLLILYLILIIPLFIIIKLNKNIDISPFKNDVKNILPHVIVLTMILLFQLLSRNFSYFSFNVFFSMFIIAFYIIYLITGVYLDEAEKSKKNHAYENSDNYNMKYLSFIKNYQNNIQNPESNIISLFLMNIFGFNDVKINMNIEPNADQMDEYELQALQLNKAFHMINVNNFKNIVFILFVLLLCILFVYLVLYFFKPQGFELYGMFNPNKMDQDLLYNFAFIPLLCLMIVLFVIVMTKEYNTFINKHIFYNPNSLYRKQLKEINTIFNNVLENDTAKSSNNSVCCNTANAIHLTIYSHLFTGYDINKIFVPELNYVFKCSNEDYINYSKKKEYAFSNYVKADENSIFYENTKCTSINNDLLTTVIKNTIPYYSGQAVTDFYFDKVRDSFKDKLKFCINNVLNGKTYTGKRQLELTNDFTNNNQIQLIETTLTDELTLDADTIQLIENITEEYMVYIKTLYRYDIQTIQALCSCNKVEDITVKGHDNLMNKINELVTNKTNGEYSLSIKKYHIQHFTMLSNILFSNINKLLTSNIKFSDNTLKLAKYIINNYNFYQKYKSDQFKKREFDVFDKKSFIKNNDIFKYSDIKDIVELIAIIKKSFEDINTLFMDNKSDMIEQLSIVVLSINDNNLLLRQQRNNYSDIYKKKYYFDNDINKQLIFDWKLQYIDAIADLNEKTLAGINSVSVVNTVFNNFDVKSLSTNTDLLKKSFNKIDYDKYSKDYDEIIHKYDTKYDTLIKINSDLYKNTFDKSIQGVTDEDVSKQLAINASDTSKNVIVVFVIYCVLFAITNVIS